MTSPRRRTRQEEYDDEDDWETASGLPDKARIKVIRSRFGRRDDYNNGNSTLLIWDVESPDSDFENGIIWPLGSGWEVTDRQGLSVEHEKGRAKFIDMSMMGRLINRVVKDLKVDMRSRGSARRADIWEGLEFFVERETIKNPPGSVERGIPESFEHLMPTQDLTPRSNGARPQSRRRDEEDDEPATPARRRPADNDNEAPEPPRNARRRAPANNVPDEEALEDQLIKLAQEFDDADAFQKEALKLEALTDDSPLYADVLDDGPRGLYARANRS